MKLIDRNVSDTYNQLLLEELPKALLEAIALHQGITVGQLISSVHRLFPSSIDIESHRKLSLAIIHWLKQNGDITGCGNQRFMALPPYGIELSNDIDNTIFKICGDPRLDERISSEVQSIGCIFESRSVQKDLWVGEGNTRITAQVGLIRKIKGKTNVIPKIGTVLQELKMPLLRPDKMAEKLPSIINLVAPPANAYQSPAPSSGIWQAYFPELKTISRWKQIDRWASMEPGLLHWQSSEDWRGKENERYFYYNGSDMLADLSSTIALLWLYRKDREVDNPKRLWWYKNTIWVPTELPDLHANWLHLISDSNIERMNGQLQEITLKIEANSTAITLHKTLGLEVVNLPPRL